MSDGITDSYRGSTSSRHCDVCGGFFMSDGSWYCSDVCESRSTLVTAARHTASKLSAEYFAAERKRLEAELAQLKIDESAKYRELIVSQGFEHVSSVGWTKQEWLHPSARKSK